jgi:hypothetical protein
MNEVVFECCRSKLDLTSTLRTMAAVVVVSGLLAYCSCGNGRAPHKPRVQGRDSTHADFSPSAPAISPDTPDLARNASTTQESAPDSLWITYADPDGARWMSWKGPERAVRFSAPSGFGYSCQITKVSAIFYLHTGNQALKPWPDSSFRFKIYGGDGRTLLHESPVLEAIPGEPGPAIVYEPLRTILVGPGEFYVSIAPVDAGGMPTSLALSKYGGAQPRRGGGEDNLNGRSYSGSPGRWSPLEQGELSLAVMVSRPGLVRTGSFGSLQVSSAPPGAAISLDDRNTGKTTPYLFTSVAAGGHQLELRGAAGLRWDSSVSVAGGRTTAVKATLRTRPESLWATYAGSADKIWWVWTGPERAVKFNPRDFQLGYPLRIKKVSAVFYFSCPNWWPDSSFRFRIYGSDGKALLYESPVLEAIIGEPGPAVVHEPATPVLIGSGEFYVSVAPVHRSGYPSGYAVTSSGKEPRADAIPASIQGHSYMGSPGRWSAFADAEFSYSVLLSDR